jgi:glucosylceramidase
MNLPLIIGGRYGRLTVCVLMCLLMFALAPAATVAHSTGAGNVEVVQTNADLSQHLTQLPGLRFTGSPAGALPVIRVNAGVSYQRVGGFGASMTDSSAWLIEKKLPVDTRTVLMNELFGSTGIHLNFLRVPMGASDFTRNGTPYTYDDVPPGQSDPRLSHFSIAHDKAYILPALTQARTIDPQTEILASPWTPPAWMKGNQSLGNAGNGGTLRAAAYGPWAQYFVKFIQAYQHAGVPIAAITPQNEPTNPTLYPGLNFSVGSEADWVVQDLRPALQKAGLHPEIFGDDWGWSTSALAYAQATASGPAAPSFAGLAWHCYFGSPDVMSAMHQAHPGLEQIVDECSPGITPIPIAEVVIASMRDWASTVALWNLALDPTGGPAQLPNHGCKGCSGVVTIDQHNGTVSLGKTYYQLGQASAFVQSGAERISSGHFVSYDYARPGANFITAGLDDVAFKNPDGSFVLVAYDNGPSPVRFDVRWRGLGLPYILPGGAMVTLVWNRSGAGAVGLKLPRRRG